ncbi:MAG: hypothetical protein MPJ02_04160 [Nitrosopumilus sp.]|nr:hypothetical protein [Nitrosopumilus sp.]MDA7998829.1 hypothetical protein [Nitrosopumilus sp.]
MADSQIQAMVGEVLDTYSKAGRGMAIWEIERVLFLARGHVRDGPLYERLAYYWDAKGPASETVRRAVAEMVDSGAARCEGKIYRPGDAAGNDIRTGAADVAWTEAVSGIAGLDEALIEEKVWSEAPIPGFATNFGIKFMGSFKAYARSVIMHEGDGPDLQFIMDSFDEALLVLPRGNQIDDMPMGAEFFEFRLQCNLYSQSLDILVRNDPGRDELMPGRYEHALRGSAAIWETFVAISRLCGPDPQYRGRVAEWKREHEEAMAALTKIVKEFADSVEDLPIPKEEGDDEILAVMNEIDDDKGKFSRGRTVEEELEFMRKLMSENAVEN